MPSYTGRAKKRIGVSVVIIFIATTLFMVINYTPPYSPPPFETTAIFGIPEPPDSMDYGTVHADDGFSFSLAGAMYRQSDGSLLIYLTNHKYSEILIMCSVTDPSGDVIYKSGLLRQGEYVECLQQLKETGNKAMDIDINVYAFDPETYYSRGTVTLRNILQPW